LDALDRVGALLAEFNNSIEIANFPHFAPKTLTSADSQAAIHDGGVAMETHGKGITCSA
jgi:hypothetical protein